MEDCQRLTMTFQQWTEYAEARVRAGERQRWCLTCERWKFAGELCRESRTIGQHTQAAMIDDALPLFDVTEE